EREPLDRLVAEDEADLAVRDLAAPASHRRCGDFLFEQRVGDLRAVESQRCDVEEERPASCRAYGWKAAELAHRLVASSLPLRVRSGESVVGDRERDARADLVEAARHESVVDVDARNVV